MKKQKNPRQKKLIKSPTKCKLCDKELSSIIDETTSKEKDEADMTFDVCGNCVKFAEVLTDFYEDDVIWH